jgi:predicted NUDIX family phosphoesterase
MKKHQQHIIAIPADKISHDGDGRAMIEGHISGEDVIIAQRAMLEVNEAYRQIIPYTVLRSGDRYAAYRRTPKGGENRLHGQVSIGFGGHVDLVDVVFDPINSVVDLKKTIDEGSRRELDEELVLGEGVEIVKFTELNEKIVSNANPVDRVHIGLVNIAEIEGDESQVASGEDQLDFLGFLTVDELKALEDLESWTQALVEHGL